MSLLFTLKPSDFRFRVALALAATGAPAGSRLAAPRIGVCTRAVFGSALLQPAIAHFFNFHISHNVTQ